MKLPEDPPKKKKVKFVLPDNDGPQVVVASKASNGEYYWTAQSDGRVLVQVIGPANLGGICLRCWDPAYQEWRDVNVDYVYKLSPIKEGTVKIPEGNVKTDGKKVKAAKEPKVSKRLKNQLGTTTKKGPDETWGVAFKKLNTARQIVDFMKKEFPTIDKKWDSWVNHFRQKYNKGELGQPAPKEPIAMFGGKKAK